MLRRAASCGNEAGRPQKKRSSLSASLAHIKSVSGEGRYHYAACPVEPKGKKRTVVVLCVVVVGGGF
jgi:hypothetical protein